MIWVGIDDTDTLETRGTNQLARILADVVAHRYLCERIVRHQLCPDPRIPCTSKNGSASLWLRPLQAHDSEWLWKTLRDTMLREFIEGSDPGLCLAENIPMEVTAFGQLAQREIVTQDLARALAAQTGLRLEGLGGTQGGVIGALAAVGLAITGGDGRIVHSHQWPADWTGTTSCAELARCGIEVWSQIGELITSGRVDLGKKCRPNCRDGKMVLYVEPSNSVHADWRALKPV